jgi:hypothetical protein
MNSVRVNLHTAKLPQRLWWYAAQYAVYIHNRTPKTAINFQTPDFKRYGANANLDNLHAFGTPCVVFNEARKNKLLPKGKCGVWLDFAEFSKGHYIYFGMHIGIERNLQFVDPMSQIEGEIRTPKIIEILSSTTTNDESMDNTESTEPELMDVDPDTIITTTPRKSSRIASQKARGLLYDEVELNIMFYLTEFNVYYADNVGNPIAYKDTLIHPNEENWIISMKTEVDSLEELGTWEYVKPPTNANIIGSRFVYKTKLEFGKPTKLKSQLIAQGFSQRGGIDFYANDLFAPVARMSSTRFVLTLAASLDFEIVQLDIKSAYLYGNITKGEDLYLCSPPGNFLPNLPPGYVLKLKKTLYGLKQAGRRWYEKLCDILVTALKLTKSNFDNTIFFRYHKNKLILLLSVHVDDLTLCADSYTTANAFTIALGQHVQVTNGGDIHWMLDMEIQCDQPNCTIKLWQKHYIENIFKQYNFDQEHTCRTPMLPGQNFSPRPGNQPQQDVADIKHYMSLVGSLRYVADCTRPDISYCTSQLARYLNDPGEGHYAAAKHCYLYLKGTCNYWLNLESPDFTTTVGYADSDGMSTYGNKPIMGYTFKFNNLLISWSSKQGTLITLSVTEAELYALAHASTEAIYLKKLIAEILNTTTEPITIFTDSASTIAILNAPEEQHTQCTKHFEIRKNFITDRIEQKFIDVKHVVTNDQLADLLTKALSSDKNKHFTQLLCLCA